LADVAKLTIGQLIVLVALFLPGFVSIKIDRLVHPGDDLKAPELILDSFGYSVINAGFLGGPIWVLVRVVGDPHANAWLAWPLSVVIFLVGPVVWPILLRRFQRIGARRGWLMGGHRFAWDEFFTRREPAWIIVHLHDGGLVGGYVGDRSYTTLAPQSGHIYIEELWQLDDHGAFLEKIPSSKGALFRPEDYHWVELISDETGEQ